MSSAKQDIIQRIRKALITPSPLDNIPDFDAPIYQPFEDDLAVIFAAQFQANKGFFYYCENEQDFLLQINEFVRQRQLKDVFVWEKNLINMLRTADFHPHITEANFSKVQAGITFCEALVARTGSVVVSSRQEAGRRLNILPPIHVVVAYTSQILPHVKDALEFVEEKYAPDLPSMISVISGASRTADIEKMLVLGAHGPKELYLFLIEDVAI